MAPMTSCVGWLSGSTGSTVSTLGGPRWLKNISDTAEKWWKLGIWPRRQAKVWSWCSRQSGYQDWGAGIGLGRVEQAWDYFLVVVLISPHSFTLSHVLKSIKTFCTHRTALPCMDVFRFQVVWQFGMTAWYDSLVWQFGMTAWYDSLVCQLGMTVW